MALPVTPARDLRPCAPVAMHLVLASLRNGVQIFYSVCHDEVGKEKYNTYTSRNLTSLCERILSSRAENSQQRLGGANRRENIERDEVQGSRK